TRHSLTPSHRNPCNSPSFPCHDPAPTAIYTLSLHDALPISARHRKQSDHDRRPGGLLQDQGDFRFRAARERLPQRREPELRDDRSEEHTSELQSRGHIVCRLLLEKKKNHHEFHYNLGNALLE